MNLPGIMLLFLHLILNLDENNTVVKCTVLSNSKNVIVMHGGGSYMH